MITCKHAQTVEKQVWAISNNYSCRTRAKHTCVRQRCHIHRVPHTRATVLPNPSLFPPRTPCPPNPAHGFPGPYARSLVCAGPAKSSLSLASQDPCSTWRERSPRGNRGPRRRAGGGGGVAGQPGRSPEGTRAHASPGSSRSPAPRRRREGTFPRRAPPVASSPPLPGPP